MEAGTAAQDPGSELPLSFPSHSVGQASKKASLDLGGRSRFHVLIGAAAKSRCQSHGYREGRDTEIFFQTITLRFLPTLKSNSSWVRVRERSWSSPSSQAKAKICLSWNWDKLTRFLVTVGAEFSSKWTILKNRFSLRTSLCLYWAPGNELTPKEADWPLLARHPQSFRITDTEALQCSTHRCSWGHGEGTIRDHPRVWPSFSPVLRQIRRPLFRGLTN